jgi:hypothetical protein
MAAVAACLDGSKNAGLLLLAMGVIRPYSSCSSYEALCSGQPSILGAREWWKTRAPDKGRFFMWLAILGCCWTSEHCHRHGLRDSADYALCSQHLELLNHLLVGCSYSREVWFTVLNCCGWSDITPTLLDSLFSWWLRVRKWVSKPRRCAFDSLVFGVAWGMWL